MKPIQYFNAIALAISSSFGVTLGVVTLIYAIYLNREPRLQEDWPLLVAVTGTFITLMLMSGLTFWAQRRDKAWRWIAQAVLFAAVGIGSWTMYRALA